MEVSMKLTAAVLRALINAMKRRCAGFPLGYEIETATIEAAEEMLDTIEKSIKAPDRPKFLVLITGGKDGR